MGLSERPVSREDWAPGLRAPRHGRTAVGAALLAAASVAGAGAVGAWKASRGAGETVRPIGPHEDRGGGAAPSPRAATVPAPGSGAPAGAGAEAAAGADATAARALADVARAWFPSIEGRPHLRRVVASGAPLDGPVVLVVVDTLRPDRLAPYAPGGPPTPFLSRLAAEGIVFANAFADAPWTRPSLASMLTGLYPSRHGADRRWEALGPSAPVLPELLRAHGWRSGAVVANVNAGRAFGYARGFDDFLDRKAMGWSGPPRARAVVDAAVDWIDRRTDPRFFLWVLVVDPHDPYAAPPAWEERLVPAGLAKVAPLRVPPWERPPLAPDVRARTLAAYDAEVAYADAELVRLAAALERKGWYDRATVVFTSDHGEAFGEHGVFKHGYHLRDEVLRVPLVVKSPRLRAAAGAAFTGLVQGVDLMPTLMQLCGWEPPLGTDGRSWLGRRAGSRDVVVSEVDVYGISGRAVRGPEGVLIRTYPVDEKAHAAEVGDRRKTPSANFGTTVRERWYAWPADPRLEHPTGRADAPAAARLAEEAARLERGLAARRTVVGPEDLSDGDVESLRSLGYY